MKDEYPRDLTPEEIEDLRRDKRETHAWFLENHARIIGTETLEEKLARAKAREYAKRQEEYFRAGQYPPGEEMLYMSTAELEAFNDELKKIHAEARKGEAAGPAPIASTPRPSS